MNKKFEELIFTIFIEILINFILFVVSILLSILSILIFDYFLINLKGKYNLLIFILVPLTYFILYIIIKKSKKKDIFTIQRIFLFNSLILLIYFSFLINLRYNIPNQGINNIPLNITVQPYVFEDAIYLYNRNSLLESNKIYNKYNITIIIKEPKILNMKLDSSEKKQFFDNQNCSMINSIYNLTNLSNKTIKLIIINYNSFSGMRAYSSICEKGDLIVLTLNNTADKGWVLAHETGHILSVKPECWKYNLMKELSSIDCNNPINFYIQNSIIASKPDLLTQTQLDTMVKTILFKFN